MLTELEGTLTEEGPMLPAAAVTTRSDGTDMDVAIRRVLGGETEAFEEMLVHIEGKVLAVAWRMLGDRDQARDAAQEIYLRIFRSLDRFRLGEDFHAWAYRITVNVCLDHLKARGPTAPELMDLPDYGHVHPEEGILHDQRRALVRRALTTLTPAERAALILRDLEGLPTEQVAQTLGIRAATVRSQISSARSKLQIFCSRLLGTGRPSGPGGRNVAPSSPTGPGQTPLSQLLRRGES